MQMEIGLTIAGWVSVGILAWFIYGWLRDWVRSMRKPKALTNDVKKDVY
jgi:hypothetical protein